MAAIAGGQAEKAEMRAVSSIGGHARRPRFVSSPRKPARNPSRRPNAKRGSRQTDSKHYPSSRAAAGWGQNRRGEGGLTGAAVVRVCRTGSRAEFPRCLPGARFASRLALGDVASSLRLAPLQASRARSTAGLWSAAAPPPRYEMGLHDSYPARPIPWQCKPPPDRARGTYHLSPSRRASVVEAAIKPGFHMPTVVVMLGR